MRGFRMLAVALTAGVLLSGLAAPARVEVTKVTRALEVTPVKTCSAGSPYELRVQATYSEYYRLGETTPVIRVWQTVDYRQLNGGPSTNVDLAIYDGNTRIWEGHGGDHVTSNLLHRSLPAAVTSAGQPTDTLRVTAIFDQSLADDPSCTVDIQI